MPDLVFPNAVPNFLPEVMAGQQAGLQRKRLNALSLAASDPDAATSALVAAGDLQGANELANMRYVQSQRQLMQNALGALQGSPEAAPTPSGAPAIPTAPVSSAPPTTPTAPNTSPAPSAPTADQADAAMEKLDQLDGIRTKLQSLPYEQRKPALQSVAPDLAQIGFGGDQLAQFDPTDQNLAKIGEQSQQLRMQVAQQGRVDQSPADPNAAQAPQAAPQQPQDAGSAPAAPQGAPAQPAPAGAAPSGGLDLNDARTQKALELLAVANPPMAQALISLGSDVMPHIQSTRNNFFFNDKNGKVIGAAPTEQGIQYDFDAQGNITGAHNVPGFSEATAEQERAREAAKQGVDIQYAGPRARAEAAGHGAGAAPYDVVEIPNSDGSTTKGVIHVDAQGNSYFLPIRAVGGPKGAPGQAAPAVGTSQTPGAKTFAEHDAAALMDTVQKEASPERQVALQGAIASAQQAVKSAMAMNPTAWTPNDKRVAEMLNVVGLDKNRANDLNYYATLIPQITRGSFSTFPRLEKEFELVKDAIPSLKTPRDAAALTFATIAATNQRNLDFAKFANQYTASGNTSQAGLNRAWQASPMGQRSLFADPTFQGVQIDGKPATYINPQPHNGHVYGVFRPGTPYAQTFLVQ